MRHDVRLALSLIVSPLAIAVLAFRASFEVTFVLCLLALLVIRTLATPLSTRGTLERLDAAVAVGVVGFLLVLAERIRTILGL